MIKRFLTLAIFFVAGMAIGLVAAGLLARTPEAASEPAWDERTPPPARVEPGPHSPGPIEIEASHGYGF